MKFGTNRIDVPFGGATRSYVAPRSLGRAFNDGSGRGGPEVKDVDASAWSRPWT